MRKEMPSITKDFNGYPVNRLDDGSLEMIFGESRMPIISIWPNIPIWTNLNVNRLLVHRECPTRYLKRVQSGSRSYVMDDMKDRLHMEFGQWLVFASIKGLK